MKKINTNATVSCIEFNHFILMIMKKAFLILRMLEYFLNNSSYR